VTLILLVSDRYPIPRRKDSFVLSPLTFQPMFPEPSPNEGLGVARPAIEDARKTPSVSSKRKSFSVYGPGTI